jgi:hypothetical protein
MPTIDFSTAAEFGLADNFLSHVIAKSTFPPMGSTSSA